LTELIKHILKQNRKPKLLWDYICLICLYFLFFRKRSNHDPTTSFITSISKTFSSLEPF